jgi:hypothetical protein
MHLFHVTYCECFIKLNNTVISYKYSVILRTSIHALEILMFFSTHRLWIINTLAEAGSSSLPENSSSTTACKTHILSERH